MVFWSHIIFPLFIALPDLPCDIQYLESYEAGVDFVDFPQSSHADASYTQTAYYHLHIRQMHPISPQVADFSSKSDIYSAVKEAAENAGAKRVFIVEEPMAAAVGAGLPVSEPTGSMIVDIGGGTSEVAVISLRGIVASRSVRVAGDEFDKSIINFIKKKYNLLIGERTAENIKIEIGSAYPSENERTMEIKGRNLLNGLPENITVTSTEIRDALTEPLSRVIDAIKVTLEETPPELSSDIIDQGITLAGGGALLRGLDKLISRETGMPVYIAEYPLDCVAEGTGKILEDLDKFEDALNDDVHYY